MWQVYFLLMPISAISGWNTILSPNKYYILFVGFEFFDVPLFQNTDSHITYLFHQAIISQEYLISQLAIKKSTL